jgi:peptide deformylase
MRILLWPHAALKRVCEPVDLTDTEFRGQLEEMKRVAQAAGGIGLAANQVGLTKRMLVAYQPGDGWLSFVNPRIVEFVGAWSMVDEGCLSLPGIFIPHKRNSEVVVESVDLETGSIVVNSYRGQLGHILQHEIDHLDGKMMVDYLPSSWKDHLRVYMRKLRRR